MSSLISMANLVYAQSIGELFPSRTELNRFDLPNSIDGTEEMSFEEVICKNKEFFPKNIQIMK